MKFQITFKDPDGVSDSISDASKDDEKKEHIMRNFASSWIEWGEYVTIEFDTEACTATVLSV